MVRGAVLMVSQRRSDRRLVCYASKTGDRSSVLLESPDG